MHFRGIMNTRAATFLSAVTGPARCWSIGRHREHDGLERPEGASVMLVPVGRALTESQRDVDVPLSQSFSRRQASQRMTAHGTKS